MVIRLLAVLLLTCATFVTAQAPHVPLVELYTDNQGLYFPAGRTLYAVIFDDSRLEYMDTTNHDLVVKHRVLTAAELIVLRQRLEGKPILQFTGIINAEHQPQGFSDH